MRFSHKVIMVSAAALMSISPVLANPQVANAATKTTVKKTVTKKSTEKDTTSKKTTTAKAAKTTTKSSTATKKAKTSKSNANNSDTDVIEIGRNSYVYYANGKRNKTYKVGKKVWPVIGKGAKINAYGTKTINGQLYYFIGNNSYIKASNIATINGKKNKNASASAKSTSTKKSSLKKIKLIHNAFVYDKNGKRIKSVGKLTKGSTISYINVKKIKGKKYFNLGKGQYVKTTNAKYEDPDDIPDPTIVQLVHNSLVYDENGEPITSEDKLIQGAQYQVLAAKQINGKWYYQIGNDGSRTQWIKAVNAAVVSGPELIKDPDFTAPSINNDNDSNTSVVTLKANPVIYDVKGNQLKNISFNIGHTARVNEARYIWLASQKRAVLAYRLVSVTSPDGYVLTDDIESMNGASLTPVNTQQEAQEAGTVATSADKQKLNAAISSANAVKASDAYKLASSAAQSAYDKAISAGQTVSTSTTSTLLDVNNALAAINKAQSALTGNKVQVANMQNLTDAEKAAIIKLVASANNVNESNVQFTNNNTQLVITDSNNSSFTKTVNTSDYAVQSTTPATTTNVTTNNQ